SCPPDLVTGGGAVNVAGSAPPAAEPAPAPSAAGAATPNANTAPPASPPATPAGSGNGAAKSPARGTGSSSAGQAVDARANAQQAAGVIPSDGDAPSRGVRVFVAAVAGALGGARIVSVISRTRRRVAAAVV